jgi:hypothetical protein
VRREGDRRIEKRNGHLEDSSDSSGMMSGSAAKLRGLDPSLQTPMLKTLARRERALSVALGRVIMEEDRSSFSAFELPGHSQQEAATD